MALNAHAYGSVLLHGALAERDGCGIVMAGPAGVGKTTASKRLPPPWRSLSDDHTLIVRDSLGVYWAHPWPTWSTLMFAKSGTVWDVKHYIPLKGIFFLSKHEKDQVKPIGEGEALCRLVSSIEQAYQLITRDFRMSDKRSIGLEFFERACELAKDRPCYRLFASFEGPFWREIDRVIDAASKGD
ncbi:MAG: SynChlorMet cassette protein ScmC [Anaerolineales bacterium]